MLQLTKTLYQPKTLYTAQAMLKHMRKNVSLLHIFTCLLVNKYVIIHYSNDDIKSSLIFIIKS